MATTSARFANSRSRRVEPSKSKSAHSRFLRTAPSLVALLGIEADSSKSDAQLFNEFLADDTKEDTKPNKKKQNNKKKTVNNKSKKKKTANKDPKNSKKDTSKKKTKKDKNKTKKQNKKGNKDKKKKNVKKENKEQHFATVKTTTTSVPTNLNLLKKRAQAELERLADENDDLFHEKERLKIKLNDLQHELHNIKETMDTDQGYKDENDRLRLMVQNYTSEQTTLQTEVIMLRELMDEYNTNNKVESPVVNPDDSDNREKMETVKKLVKEKNDILNEFDEMKLMYDSILKENVVFKKELHECKSEIKVLSEKLYHQQDQHLTENKLYAERIDDINKDMKRDKDQLLLEYERKEQQFIQTVEEQLKYIDELENENQDLQRHHTRQVSVDNRDGAGMYSLLKLKTQANIFSSQNAVPTDNGNDYSNSVSFDDEYEYLSDGYMSYGDDYTPMTPGGDTFVEYPDAVGDVLLVKHKSILSGDFSTGYGTPATGAMSSYWEMMQAAKHKDFDEKERKKMEEERIKKQKDIEIERQKREEIMLEQKQQSELDNKALAVLVGKMKQSNKPIEQTSIRALGYFINKNGRLLPLSKEKEIEEKEAQKKDSLKVLKEGNEEEDKEEEDDEDIGLLSISFDEDTLEQLKSAITIYLFDTLLKYYKFRPKQIGNTKKKKNNNVAIQIDYQYKTLLFSSNFNKTDTLFVIIPAFRGGICYWNLCIDKGIVYGTLLPYIEFALSYNNGSCSVLILDPKGIDVNDIQWSIFKIYDKFIAKRIRSNKVKRIVFIGALKEGNLISHLLDRRGKELKNVVKSCIFLGCDDPYMTKPMTAKIYENCAVNYINSNLPMDQEETGTKPNGDSYFIPRRSAGIANFCCIAAYSAAIKTIKNALSDT